LKNQAYSETFREIKLSGSSASKGCKHVEHVQHCDWIQPGVMCGTNIKQVSQPTNSFEDRSPRAF
jgi:hypothetical protein